MPWSRLCPKNLCTNTINTHHARQGSAILQGLDWDAEAGWEHFVDQRRKDLLKDEYTRRTNGLLFRVSYMQLSIISQLVQEMIEQSNSGKTGVVYMDETAYKDWGPLE